MLNQKHFFLKPQMARHRQYEALRAIVVDELSVVSAAKKYAYKPATLYSLLRDHKAEKLIFFPDSKRGPKERNTPLEVCQRVLSFRKENLSVIDIKMRLAQEGYKFSTSTIARILRDAQVPKLPRRISYDPSRTQKNQAISARAKLLDFEKLKPFRYDCPSVGIFFFLSYLIESDILSVLKKCKLPESSIISAEQACLSMLALKLIGSERLSHMQDYDHEPGLGLFAGLNFLPKKSFMASYSCRTSEAMLQGFQQQLMTLFQKKYPKFYQSNFINLDFHSIPHFGDESKMEKVWCGARGKAIKGANTIFAQDSESNAILYTHADILRKDEAKEIQRFVTYWKSIRKELKETLVFDCKLTTYAVLDDLAKENVQFITLRKRTKKLIESTDKIPEKEWQKIFLPIPKRKHKACLIHVSEVTLPNCKRQVKQIIVTQHGRAQPTYIITNNRDISLKEILIVYAKRWHIEQKFAELVSFFNLNALSSPLMIRIHFDILWTVIADTLYHRFAQDLPRFEHERADSIFRHFINIPGQVIYDGKEFVIKIRKRAHTPILLGVKRLQQPVKIPWLDNRALRIEWTA
jgi:Transposase DDE domain